MLEDPRFSLFDRLLHTDSILIMREFSHKLCFEIRQIVHEDSFRERLYNLKDGLREHTLGLHGKR